MSDLEADQSQKTRPQTQMMHKVKLYYFKVFKTSATCWDTKPEVRGQDCTSREVLNNSSGGRVEDDVCSIIEVVKVVSTIKAPVAKHVIQRQFLQTHTDINTHTLTVMRTILTLHELMTDWPPRSSSSLWCCSSPVCQVTVRLDSLEACRKPIMTFLKNEFIFQYFCLVFYYKYLNILKSRYIYLRCRMTYDIKSCFLINVSKWSEFLIKTRTNICQWGQKNLFNSNKKSFFSLLISFFLFIHFHVYFDRIWQIIFLF